MVLWSTVWGLCTPNPGHVATVIRCSNLSTTAVPIGVEIFDEQGNVKGFWKRTSLEPQQSFVFATAPVPDLAGVLVPGSLEAMENGKAQGDQHHVPASVRGAPRHLERGYGHPGQDLPALAHQEGRP